jgi:hypothetical protein
MVNWLAILFQLCTNNFAIMCSAVYSTRTITGRSSFFAGVGMSSTPNFRLWSQWSLQLLAAGFGFHHKASVGIRHISFALVWSIFFEET